ncbi:MAG: DUF5127 domain-containing protein, partial [Verrucomicrobia bacterium]|nr:DUF5127 domain-containing protein [Verrucomicrobiota bacterium]
MLNPIVAPLRLSSRGITAGALILGWLFLTPAGLVAADWQPAKGPLLTRWAKDVKPNKVHAEHPRPQLVREQWQNLNGLWDYAIAAKDAARPAAWDGEILVPFPVESALSGVMKRVSEQERLWYHRTFKVPAKWKGQRVLLHFGAVDWEATVYVNGREVGSHRGGYDAFTFDITAALKPSGDQELVVSVWDPTDAGYQPRGKQVRQPGGIWYTPTTGIWQTAWLEAVSETYVRELRITPDVDASAVTIQSSAFTTAGPTTLEVEVLDGRKVVQRGSVTTEVMTRSIPPQIAPQITLSLPNAKLWSPDSPFLYGLRIALVKNGRKVDQVESYFGMRKIALGKDADGILRLMLNNQPLFQYGPLDQGFWPDGLYTAPTDEALRYDIEMTKKLGFNMARKHVKIEPARWYYWCDQLGLLVWQDMPSGDKYIGGRDPDIERTPESARQFETELRAMVDGFYNHPSIVMWVPYNEGWGQWDTARIAELIKKWDPTRLVNSASGWTDRRVGDVHDIHAYPGPAVPPLEEKRAVVLGEFGGLGLPVKGHTWQDEKNWGYRSYTSSEALTDAYLALLEKLHPMTGVRGLAAAVYTQTTDVEIEVNGLMTYDRELVKMDQAAIAAAAQRLYTPPPKRVQQGNNLVPPATPLVTHDPYFSIWSPADRLTDADTVHWTGRPHRLTGVLSIDQKTYRVLGVSPRNVPALPQVGLEVLPTRTIYTFEGAGVRLKLTFTTPALPEDLEILSRPVTHITWQLESTDGKKHRAAVHFFADPEIAVNDPGQRVTWQTEKVGGLEVVRVGTVEQPVLQKKGDDLRIDWGYLYLAVPDEKESIRAAGGASHERNLSGVKFADRDAGLRNLGNPVSRRHLVLHEGPEKELPASEAPLLAAVLDFDEVGSQPVSRWLMLAYDDLY